MEFCFDFAERKLESAMLLGKYADSKSETARSIAYDCHVSMEISMKALLEQSGMSEKRIRKHSHNLMGLLDSIWSLKDSNGREIRSMGLWSVPVRDGVFDSVGLLLKEASKGSVYPNQMRYGNQVVSLEPLLLIEIASTVLKWCRLNSGRLSV